MDFSFSETEREVAKLARTILGDLATNERLRAHEQSGAPFDAAVWSALGDADLLGVAIPEQHGGSGIGLLALLRLLQEIGRAVAPVPAHASLAFGALALARFGSDDDRALLADVATGHTILTAALSEPDSSDPMQPTTRLDARGRLFGTKTLVPYGAQAARILVPATSDDGIALVWVEAGHDGVSIEAQRGADTHAYAQIRLEAAQPVSRLAVGGADTLAWIVQHAVVARCFMQLGVTERAIEMTGAYGRERVQFERPIGSFQAFHQRAADAFMQVEAIRLTAWEAASRLAAGEDATDQVAVAKWCAAEGGAFAAYAWQHLHGGIGIDVDYPLHRYFKWAIQLEHELGSAPVQLERLGRTIEREGIPAER